MGARGSELMDDVSKSRISAQCPNCRPKNSKGTTNMYVERKFELKWHHSFGTEGVSDLSDDRKSGPSPGFAGWDCLMRIPFLRPSRRGKSVCQRVRYNGGQHILSNTVARTEHVKKNA